MDIGRLRPIEQVEVNILHPVTKEKTDIFFTVCGTDSKQYRSALRDVMVKRMANQDAETSELENDEIELLAHCTASFKGLMIDGEEPANDFDSIVKIYSEFPWLKEQIDRFIANKNNFFLKA